MNFALLLTFKLIYLWLYFGNICKITLFREPIEISKNMPTFISIGPPITKEQPLKKMKICVSFGGSIFKKKVADILNLQWIKYLGKCLSYLRNEGIGLDYYWIYGPSKLLLHFIEYPLNQIFKRHAKIAVDLTMQYFKGSFQKKYLLKIWSCLVHPPQNCGPVKFFWNWTETIF